MGYPIYQRHFARGLTLTDKKVFEQICICGKIWSMNLPTAQQMDKKPKSQMKIILLMLLGCGCNREYTTELEYVEHRRVDAEKGWVYGYKATRTYHWGN